MFLLPIEIKDQFNVSKESFKALEKEFVIFEMEKKGDYLLNRYAKIFLSKEEWGITKEEIAPEDEKMTDYILYFFNEYSKSRMDILVKYRVPSYIFFSHSWVLFHNL